MSDLRLYSLGLLAGLSTTVLEPVGSDGTSIGNVENQDLTEVDITLDNAASELVIYWTGWWPELHFERVAAIQNEQVTDDFSFHFKRDLCDNIEVVGFTPDSTWDDEDEQEFWSEALEEIAPFTVFSVFLGACLLGIRYIEGTAGLGFISGVGAVVVGLWIAAIVSLRISIDLQLASGDHGLGWAYWVCLFLGLGCFVSAFGGYAIAIPAILIALIYPPLLFWLWEFLVLPLTVNSIAIRLVLILTGLLLLSFAAQYRVGVF